MVLNKLSSCADKLWILAKIVRNEWHLSHCHLLHTWCDTANVPNSESWKHFLEICFQRLLRGKKIQLPLKMWASRCTNLPLHAPQNRFLSCNLKGDRLNTKINVFLRIFLFFFLRAHSTSRLPYYLTRLVEKALLQNKTWRFLVVQFTIGSSSSGGLSHVTGSKGTLCRCQKSAMS